MPMRLKSNPQQWESAKILNIMYELLNHFIASSEAQCIQTCL